MPSSQQKTAATNINRVFLEKALRYAILKSQCQAGKTGAYHALINLMLAEGTVQRAYVLCGSHELELRNQAIEDAMTHNAAAFERGEIKVLFRQDFARATMNITNTLIIVDESHLDQTKGQQLDMFMARHGLSMDGNSVILKEKNTFIVSVDATPYSELAALKHGETPYEKHVEELAPGEDYVGISDYLYTHNLQSTFDISREPHRFAALFPKGVKKYALLRLSAGRKGGRNVQEVAVEKLAHVLGWRVLHYTAAKTDIAITKKEQACIKEETGRDVPSLEDTPDVPTIAIIRGRLRAGKVVPKKNIAFVWEGAKSSKTDALIQGLAGRMCGYPQDLGEDDDAMKLDPLALPMLFVPSSALERHEKKVVKSSEIERAILVPDLLPTKATNLKKPKVASEAANGKTQCPPLRIRLDAAVKLKGGDESYVGYDSLLAATSDSELAEAGRDILLENISMVNSLPCSNAQKAEIKAFAEIARPHARRFQGGSQLSYFKELIKAYKNGTCPAEHIADCPEMTFFITYPGYEGLSEADTCVRDLYVIFYTKASTPFAGTLNAPLSARIAETNGRSIFSISNRSTSHPLVGAGATGFCEANLKKPENFEKALRAYMTHWKTSELIVSREIQSLNDRFTLDKAKFHYRDTKINDVQRICVKLGTEFGVKMNVKFARSSAGARGHFNVKSISW